MGFLFFEIGRSGLLLFLDFIVSFILGTGRSTSTSSAVSSTVHSLHTRRNIAIVIKHLTEHVALGSTYVDLSCLVVARFKVGLSFICMRVKKLKEHETCRDCLLARECTAGIMHMLYCREYDIKLTKIYT